MNSIKIGTASKLINLTRPSLLNHDLQKPWWRQILDPGGEYVNKWNRIFLFTSLVALFLDPLFLLLPRTADSVCMMMDFPLGVTLTSLRSIVDLFSFLHIAMKFRTAYVAPSSRVFGRGELVTDPRKIAIRYLKSDLIFDLVAALPLPQVVIWFIIPAVKRITTAAHANHTISYVIILQYVPRLFVIFPLSKRITKTTGVLAKTAWAGAAYNLLLYTLSSHILGAFWYFLSVDHQYSCWRRECLNERLQKGLPRCDTYYLDCNYLSLAGHEAWMNTTNVYRKCNAQSPLMLGMFSDAFTEGVASALFFDKYFYCLWWGLKSLSSYGQSLATSTDIKETMFSSLICILGLVLFSLLIGDMQTYLQSTTRRLEEWRVKRRDTEEWMRHRQLPPGLQDRVRKFVQYKWLATRGVDEEDILRSLPLDLRRQIQRHLCLSLVRRVPFFSQMDDQLLDAICERLVSSLNTKDTYVVREGDPVNDMLFVIRGQLESSTTNGGRSGFFNSITLKPGDFCGEELLTWALMPASNHNLPSSTRTVRCLSEVEAFALRAEDLKFVASQFKRLHSKKLQHAFRYYSHQWRTWGACFVQSAWRRYQRKKMAEDLARQEESYYYTRISDPEEDSDCDREFTGNSGSEKNRQQVGVGATMLASKFAANTRRGVVQKVVETPGLKMPKLLKPDEPDFSADDQVD